MLKKILGIVALEERVERNERLIKQILDRIEDESEEGEVVEEAVLNALASPMTTDEVASVVSKSRERTSYILNKLETEGKVKEVGKRGRKILYGKG